MSYAARLKGERATWHFLGRIPQCPLLYRMSGPVRKGEIKMLPLQNFSFIGSIALDWLRSKGRVEGFHLRFANVRPIFVGFWYHIRTFPIGLKFSNSFLCRVFKDFSNHQWPFLENSRSYLPVVICSYLLLICNQVVWSLKGWSLRVAE